MKTASIESGAALGFIGAIGACGGYLIPSGFGKSIAITGGPQLALVIYLTFYAACLALTWWYYLRRSPAASSATPNGKRSPVIVSSGAPEYVPAANGGYT